MKILILLVTICTLLITYASSIADTCPTGTFKMKMFPGSEAPYSIHDDAENIMVENPGGGPNQKSFCAKPGNYSVWIVGGNWPIPLPARFCTFTVNAGGSIANNIPIYPNLLNCTVGSTNGSRGDILDFFTV